MNLPTPHVLSREIATLRTELSPCGRTEGGKKNAAAMAAMLVGGYAQQKLNSAKAFTAHLENLFCRYPADICARVVENHPQTHKFLNIAEVREALDAAVEGRKDKLRRKESQLRQASARSEAHRAEREAAEHSEEVRAGLQELVARLKAKPGNVMDQRPEAHADRAYDEDRRAGHRTATEPPIPEPAGEEEEISP